MADTQGSQQVNKTLQDIITDVSKNSNKRRIGYTVGAYSSVLESLQRLDDQGSSSIMGKGKINWEQVQNLQYDPSTGFSETDNGIWKMAVRFRGAFPIFNTKTGKYFIETLPGQELDDGLGDSNVFPSNFENTTCTGDFKVGAYLDIRQNGLAYFQKMYTNSRSSAWTDEIVNHIISEGWVVAQIFFPSKKEYFNVKVFGNYDDGGVGSACLTLNTPILGSNGWDETGITLNAILTDIQQTSREIQIIPSGGEYEFSCLGNSYNYVTGTIKNFNREHLENMKKRQDTNSDEVVKLSPINIQECFVRLFIPPHHRQDAEGYFQSKNFTPLPLVYQEESEQGLTTTQQTDYSKLVFNVADGNLSVVVDYGHHGVRLQDDKWRFETEIPKIKSLADKLVAMFTANKTLVYVNKVSSRGGKPAASAREAVKKNATCIISVHFNAASSKNVNGTFVFYKENGHPESKKLAKEVFESIMSGGFRPKTKWSRYQNQTENAGFLNTVGQRCPAILLEPGFLTGDYDKEFFEDENNMVILANRIVNGVTSWYNSYKIEYERSNLNQN